jgi:acetyl esterase/lipase
VPVHVGDLFFIDTRSIVHMPALKRTGTLLVASIIALIGLAACSPFRALNAVTSGTASNTMSDIAYGPDPRHRLDVYSPRKSSRLAPIVVFFYGGSWNSGERADYAFVGKALASRGMVAVIADYRLYPDVRYPAFLEDAARAVAWAHREAGRHGGDPKRLFVMGHSAGAYNAAMLALDKRWLATEHMALSSLRGWIGLAGPYNFIPIENPDVRPVFFYPDTPPSSQPINHVTAAAPPALLIAPVKDDVVNPQRNTRALAQRLRTVGVPVTEQYFDRVSHPILIATLADPLRLLAPTLDVIAHFIDTHDDAMRNRTSASTTSASN